MKQASEHSTLEAFFKNHFLFFIHISTPQAFEEFTSDITYSSRDILNASAARFELAADSFA